MLVVVAESLRFYTASLRQSTDGEKNWLISCPLESLTLCSIYTTKRSGALEVSDSCNQGKVQHLWTRHHCRACNQRRCLASARSAASNT